MSDQPNSQPDGGCTSAPSFGARLQATIVQSPGHWRIQRETQRTVVSRDRLISPFITPMGCVGLIFLVYEAYVLSVGLANGWRGIWALALPGLAILALGLASNLVVRVESLSFDQYKKLLRIEGLRGKERISRVWAFRNIRYLRVVRPSSQSKVRLMTLIVLAGDTDKDQIAIETLLLSTTATTEALFDAMSAALPDHVVRQA
ncbi:MAG: hypothetical protein RLZZ618_2160 [Pseudomonadota bacterium]